MSGDLDIINGEAPDDDPEVVAGMEALRILRALEAIEDDVPEVQP